jgi:two-component system response regulator HydG
MQAPAKTNSTETLHVLVVDDETSSRAPVAEFWRDEGHEVRVAADGFKALGRLDDGWEPDLLITDLKMPGMDGVTLLKKMRERFPDLAVIVMTAYATVESAVEAMQEGADDYLIKPVHFGQLEVSVNKVMSHRALVRDHRRIKELLEAKDSGKAEADEMVGESRAFRELLALAQQVAKAEAPVLVAGAEGTGKRRLVRAVHDWSGRASGPFIEFNVGMVGDEIVEDQLTEAMDKAKGGTLALIGVSELSETAQGVLRNFFDDPGEDAPRLISTTKVDLREVVEAGKMSQDLVYRLGVVNLHLPSLRERREDIPLLAAHFVRQHADAYGRPRLALSERAIGIIEAFEWPGNIRQLSACMQRAVVAARGREIEARDLPREVLEKGGPQDEGPPPIPGSTLEDIERFAIMSTLEATGGSTARAAKILGISVRKVQYRLSEARQK